MTTTITTQIAKHLRETYTGGNWATANLKDSLADVSWQEATTKQNGFNTIATLVFHTTYYISAVLKVLQSEPLNAKDEYSFNHPPITSQQDWEDLLNTTWIEAEAFARAIEQLPDTTLTEDFTDKKYGNYYRNLHGIIEHTHYHLGQIVILKKMIRQNAAALK